MSCLDDAAIDELPFHVWVFGEGLKNDHQLVAPRPVIEALVNLIPVSKFPWNISPGTTNAEAIKNGLHCGMK